MGISNPDTKKTIEIMLAFGVENKKAVILRKELSALADKFNSLEKEAQNMQKMLSAVGGDSEKGKLYKKTLEAIESEMQNISGEAKKLNKELDKFDTDKIKKSAYDLRDVGEKLNNIGGALNNAGNAILSPIQGAVNAYLQAAPVYDESAMRWNNAQKEMQSNFTKIGGIAVEKLLPLVEATAKLTGQIASLLEKYPGLIDAALIIGGGLKASGMVLQGFGQIQMMRGTSQALGLGGMLQNAGASALGYGKSALAFGGSALAAVPGAGGGALAGAGALGIYGVSAASGAVIGKEIGNAINSAIGQKEQSWGDILTTAKQLSAIASPMSLLARGLNAAGFEDQASAIWNFTKSVNGLGDAVEDAGQKAADAANALEQFSEKNVQEWIAYQKQLEDAQSQYAEQRAEIEAETEKQRTDIVDRYGKQRAESESRYEQSRANAIARFAQAEKDSEADYYRSRMEAAASYSIEVQRAEEDHQRQMRQMQEEHNDRVRGLVDERDALGLVREQRDYERQRSGAEDSYNIEAARRSQDFARQMAEMDAQFRIQRERRLRDFNQQQLDAANQHAQEMALMEQNRKDQLDALDKNQQEQLDKLKVGYDKQLEMMQTNFINRLNAMSESINGNTAAWVQYMKDQDAAFQAWLRQRGYASGGMLGQQVPGRALGGPVTRGATYMVGERGPELFTARQDGRIFPAGLTAALFNPSSGAQAAGGKTLTLNIMTGGMSERRVIALLNDSAASIMREISGAFGVA